jgi:hypothetical protein
VVYLLSAWGFRQIEKSEGIISESIDSEQDSGSQFSRKLLSESNGNQEANHKLDKETARKLINWILLKIFFLCSIGYALLPSV